jgi:hypothetical protein
LPSLSSFDGKRRCHISASTKEYETRQRAAKELPYDGRLLAAPGTIALQLFVDWYQKHNQGHHSVGLIWACVLNLPREERYELHNMILVGVLPGPGETSYAQLQGALQIFTEELRQLWRMGLTIGGVRHRVFLFSVVCDTPAMRAVCGVGGISAKYGCPYCDGSYACRPGKGQSHRDWRPSKTFHPPSFDRDRQLQHAALTHARRLQNALVWVEAHSFDPIAAWIHRPRASQDWSARAIDAYLSQNIFSEAHPKKPKVDRQPDDTDDPLTVQQGPAAYSSDEEEEQEEEEKNDPLPVAASAAAAAAAAFTPAGPPAPTAQGVDSHSTRWSALLDLPYFDSVRCVPICDRRKA